MFEIPFRQLTTRVCAAKCTTIYKPTPSETRVLSCRKGISRTVEIIEKYNEMFNKRKKTVFEFGKNAIA